MGRLRFGGHNQQTLAVQSVGRMPEVQLGFVQISFHYLQEFVVLTLPSSMSLFAQTVPIVSTTSFVFVPTSTKQN